SMASYVVSYLFQGRPTPPHMYSLSLHDALPISDRNRRWWHCGCCAGSVRAGGNPDLKKRSGPSRSRAAHNARNSRRSETPAPSPDRKSTRLNSSHVKISYAVFCLKKKTLPLYLT